MYQAVIPSPIMMQVVGSQQTNGQCPPVQTHSHPSINPANDPHQPERRISSYTVNGNHSNKHQLAQHNTYPVGLYQMMRVDIPPIRRPYGGGNSGNWHRRNNGSFVPPSNMNNFRFYNNKNNYYNNNNNNDSNHDNNNNNSNNNNNNNNSSSNNNNNNNNNSNNYNNHGGSAKKQNWNNRSNRRNTFKEQLPPRKEGSNNYNSDSGFSSRSPTPNKHPSKDRQTESSDDRESIASNARPNTKKLEEIWPNPLANIAFTPQGFIQNIPNMNQFPNQQMLGFYPNNLNSSMRIQVQQNYQGKKRPPASRTSPSSQKNQKKKKNMNLIVPTFTNVLPNTHLPPDRYLSRAHLIQVKEAPENLFGSAKWDSLTKEIWERFMDHQQNEHTFTKKMMLWKYLFIYIKTVFPKYSVFLVGSTMNGFGTNSSDADICLLVRNTEIIQRNEAIFHLDQIMKCLEHCDFMQELKLIQAKVPILKFKDTIQKLDVDLNCNNAVGVRNTHMLYCYSKIDWRVKPLVLIVKLWAQSQDINDAKNMTISSYSLALMVIHFLQCGVNPPVLPCLQSMFSYKFHPHSDVHTINIHEDLKVTMEKTNHQSLGELLYEFFKYYANFNFEKYAISVRLASKILIEDCQQARTLKNNPHQWKYLCIEEPFDLTNTARSVYDYDAFLRIKTVFYRSYEKLEETYNLASIFVNQAPSINGYYHPRAPTSQ